MKRLWLLILCLLCVFSVICLYTSDDMICVGEILISAKGINAYLLTAESVTCDCCPPLWNGGVATITGVLTEIEIDDVARVCLLSEYRLYLECVEIVPCILINNQLIGWHGIISPNGDIVIYSRGHAYRFTIL